MVQTLPGGNPATSLSETSRAHRPPPGFTPACVLREKRPSCKRARGWTSQGASRARAHGAQRSLWIHGGRRTLGGRSGRLVVRCTCFCNQNAEKVIQFLVILSSGLLYAPVGARQSARSSACRRNTHCRKITVRGKTKNENAYMRYCALRPARPTQRISTGKVRVETTLQ